MKKVVLLTCAVVSFGAFAQSYMLKSNFVEIENLRDQKLKEISNSVASMVSITNIVPIDNKETTNAYLNISKGPYTKTKGDELAKILNASKKVALNIKSTAEAGMCQGFEYEDQPMLSNCSGSLVGPDLILTAGHCVKIPDFCERFKWVFDYKTDSKNSALSDFLGVNPFRSRDQIYSCKKVIKKIQSNIPIYGAVFRTDIALVQIDRPVVGRKIIEMDFEETHDAGDDIFLLSYPLGLPQKYSEGAIVQTITKAISLAILPAMGGSSGAPVFSSKTSKIVGVLTRGKDTSLIDQTNQCENINYATLSEGYTSGIAPLRKIKKAFNRFMFKN